MNIVEDKKSSLTVEIPEFDHMMCNILKDEISKDSTVDMVAYRIDHPLKGIPRLKVEGKDPKVSVKKAITSLKKQAMDVKKAVSSL